MVTLYLRWVGVNTKGALFYCFLKVRNNSFVCLVSDYSLSALNFLGIVVHMTRCKAHMHHTGQKLPHLDVTKMTSYKSKSHLNKHQVNGNASRYM